MSDRIVGFILIAVAVLILMAAQIVIKGRLSVHGAVPLNLADFWGYVLQLSRDWLLWPASLGLVGSAILWYGGVSRLPLSVAVPFAAISYPLILCGAVIFLREPFTWRAIAGNILIVGGIYLAATAQS